MKSSFGKELRIARRNRSMTQEQLADKAQLAMRFLQDLEADRKQATVTTIFKLCAALGVAPAQLLDKPFISWKRELSVE